MNPTNQTATAGQTATFTAAASGYPTPTVQWQVSTDGGKAFSDLAGATLAPLSFPATAAQNGYEYRAVFSNSVGTATTVPPPRRWTSRPRSPAAPATRRSTPGRRPASRRRRARHPTPTAVQWQVSTDGGKAFSDRAGATGNNLSFTATAAQNGDEYQAVFNNAAGLQRHHRAATLTVDFVPTVTTSAG